MDPALEDLLRALRANAEAVKSLRIELDDAYLRRIAEVEALPENQSGSDKSWVGRSLTAAAKHFAKAKPVR